MIPSRPLIVGVVNITSDSFSDGGRFLQPEAAIAHARALHDAGASVIELGPASSHPESAQVDAVEEHRRLKPVLDALAGSVPLAVDSFLVPTQEFALARGVDFLNDTRGFVDTPAPLLARTTAKLVVVHTVQRTGRASRIRRDPAAVWESIHRFCEERIRTLTDAGVDRERLILDPGMGFFLSADPEPSFEVLANLAGLRSRFGLPVLVSVSRKSFLRSATGREIDAIGPATLAAELAAAIHGADYIRTHDPGPLRDGLVVAERSGLLPKTAPTPASGAPVA